MKVHPVAALFPMLPDAELGELAKDIHENGLSEPIVLQGEVLIDGRNRLKACEMAGVTPVFKELGSKKDPIPFIISRNIHRRHLDASQRAMIAADIANLPHGGNRKNQEANLPLDPVTQKTAAKLMGVGERTVKDAKAVKTADPALAAQVTNGEITVHAAKKQVQERKMAAPKPDKPTPAKLRGPDAKAVEKHVGAIARFLDDYTAHHGIQNRREHKNLLKLLSEFQGAFDAFREGLE